MITKHITELLIIPFTKFIYQSNADYSTDYGLHLLWRMSQPGIFII